jgi:hypothetical protein
VTSPNWLRLVAGLSVIVLLTGCDVGRPTSFTGRSNSFCSDTVHQISALKPPLTPKAHLQYATDRYTAVEHLVSELTDSSLPGGSTGQQLRSRWLRPARASLTAGRTVLADLRSAVLADDNASITTTFAATNAIGTAGVDLNLLRAHGLNTCARVFTPTAG